MTRLGLPVLSIVIAISLHAAVFAQSDTATISGRIGDQVGQAIADVAVAVTQIDSGTSVAVTSNADGVYVVRNLHAGRYRIILEKDGFKTIVLDDLNVAVGDFLGRNFTMEVGAISDYVKVTAGRDELNLSPAVSTVVDRQFVEDMPLNGRSFQSLILLTPGALVTAAGQGIEGQFSVNGQRPNTNYFTVDGVGVNFAANVSVNLGQNVGGTLPAMTIGGGTNSFVSVDAMQEFRTQTSTYAPEFGRTPGAQIAIVTKSGTNAFHGTAYDYVRNDAFDARNWFNRPPQPKPSLRQHDFGGTLGGPLAVNRSFFFLSYEGLRLEQPQTVTGFFYTAATRASIAPAYQPIVNSLPLPTGALEDPACNDASRPCRASLTVSSSNPTRFDAASLRLDQALHGGWTVFLRASHTPSIASNGAFGSNEVYSRNADLVTGGITGVLRATLVNDLRLNWGRATGAVDVERTATDGAVALSTAALFPKGSPQTGLAAVLFPDGTNVSAGRRAANAANQAAFVDTLSLVRGTHQIKAGVDYRHMRPSTAGRTSYVLTVDTFDQLKAGTMGTVLLTVADPMAVTFHNWSVFVQDSWRATTRLTLTYGLRWEIDTPPKSAMPGSPVYAVEGIFDAKPLQLAPPGTPLWRTRYDNVAPRAGAAFELSPATIVRGGTGRFHDLGYGKLLGNLMFGFPNNRLDTRSAVDQPFDLTNPVFSPPLISTALSSFRLGNLSAFDPELQLPVVTQWNVALERELGARRSVSVTYLGARGHSLLRPDFVVPPELRLLGTPSISVTRNAGRSQYDALQVQFQQRLSRGLQALASYTFAKASDTESDDGGGNFFGAAWNANSAVDVDHLAVPPLAPSDFDIRHSFSTAVSYDVPAPDWGKAGRAILGGWGVDAIVKVSSAPPLNVRIQGVSPQLGAYYTQPDLVPGQPVWIAAPDQPGGVRLNPDAFTLPPDGVPGNFLRNSIRSPFAINQTDLALRRRFPLSGGTSLEFRADVFNLFNHPMFGGFSAPVTSWGRCTARPCTGQQSPFFGYVSDGNTLNVGLGGDPLSGGQSAIYAVGGPRSMQFSLKLRF